MHCKILERGGGRGGGVEVEEAYGGRGGSTVRQWPWLRSGVREEGGRGVTPKWEESLAACVVWAEKPSNDSQRPPMFSCHFGLGPLGLRLTYKRHKKALFASFWVGTA